MKKLLIVVDYQNDFVNGSLGFKKAIDLEEPIAKKVLKYKQDNDDIIFTFDTHEKDYLNTQEGKNLPIEHCIKDTEGWNLYGRVNDVFDSSMKAFYKNTFGCLELAEYLKDKEYNSIEIVGIVSNICVISNAILVKSALPETKIIVDKACIASNDDEMNVKVLDIMKGLQIEVI